MLVLVPHYASVQLQRQILVMVGLVRKPFEVVWLLFVVSRALVETKKQTEKRGQVLDQTHEHDVARRWSPGLVIWRGRVPPVSSSLSPDRLRAQMVCVFPVTSHSSDKHGHRACPGRVAL